MICMCSKYAIVVDPSWPTFMWGRAGRRCSSNAQGWIFTSRPKFWDWHGAFGSWEGGEPAEGFACHLAGGSRLVRNWNSVFTWVLVVSRNDYHLKSVTNLKQGFVGMCWEFSCGVPVFRHRKKRIKRWTTAPLKLTIPTWNVALPDKRFFQLGSRRLW